METKIRIIDISHVSDIIVAREIVKEIARNIGFNPQVVEELAIVVSEMTTNIIKFANKGKIEFSSIDNGDRKGLQIDAIDSGPGLTNFEAIMQKGYSMAGSLGYGLGTINRLMHEFEIQPTEYKNGTHLIARKWLFEPKSLNYHQYPFDIGVATRHHPKEIVNGDAFVVIKEKNYVLVGIIDGLGHGPLAHHAACVAQQYIETHSDQPLPEIFQGTHRACYRTRGVVMTICKIDFDRKLVTSAMIGNVTLAIFNGSNLHHTFIRRGVVGVNAPIPAITEKFIQQDDLIIIHSDGISEIRDSEILIQNLQLSAEKIAQKILQANHMNNDDATILIVKEVCR